MFASSHAKELVFFPAAVRHELEMVSKGNQSASIRSKGTAMNVTGDRRQRLVDKLRVGKSNHLAFSKWWTIWLVLGKPTGNSCH